MNWYVYYSQTDAHKGCVYISEYTGGSSCSPYDHPDYTPYVGALYNPHHVSDHTHPCGSKPKNNDEELHGIDVFAWASRHEWKHYEDYTEWWGDNPLDPNLDDPRDQDVRENSSNRGDHIPDPNEKYYSCSEGGPYDPNVACTYFPYGEIQGFDDQTECMFTQQTWETIEKEVESGPNEGEKYRVGDEYGKDWAKPGSRWHPLPAP